MSFNRDRSLPNQQLNWLRGGHITPARATNQPQTNKTTPYSEALPGQTRSHQRPLIDREQGVPTEQGEGHANDRHVGDTCHE